jgi:hypothetical protein
MHNAAPASCTVPDCTQHGDLSTALLLPPNCTIARLPHTHFNPSVLSFIPPFQALKADMKGHLQLHFSSADLSDKALLGVYPTTIRQRILRHLYSSPVANCWLFRCGGP